MLEKCDTAENQYIINKKNNITFIYYLSLNTCIDIFMYRSRINYIKICKYLRNWWPSYGNVVLDFGQNGCPLVSPYSVNKNDP